MQVIQLKHLTLDKLSKNILINHTCEYCMYLKITKKLIFCIKDLNNKSTTLINSCEKFKIYRATSLEDVLTSAEVNEFINSMIGR